MSFPIKDENNGLVEKETLQKIACLFVAFLYAYFLANIDVYFGVDFTNILDRENYVYYAKASAELIAYRSEKSIFIAFVNEPLFLLINYILNELMGDPESVVRVLILFSAFQVAYMALRNGGNYFICFIILLLPSVYGNFIISLRQGLALAFFLTGWYSKNNGIKYALIGFSPLIHTSFYISIFLLLCKWVIEKITFNDYVNIFMLVLCCVFIIVAMPHLGADLEIRQAAGYSSLLAADIKTSGLGLIFWFLLLLTFVGQGKIFLSDNRFQVYCLIFYVLSYLSFPPYARTIQNYAILVLMAGCSLSGVNKAAFNCLVILFFTYTAFEVMNYDLVGPYYILKK